MLHREQRGARPGRDTDLRVDVLDVVERLRLVLGWARDTLGDLSLRKRIQTDVEEGMEKTE